MNIAILDDYQDAALRHADWSALAARTRIHVFRDTLRDVDALAARLKDFDVVVTMRERTAFSRALFERLPRLRLLTTTGMVNRSIDLAAASERGVAVCGTDAAHGQTSELTWGLILALARHIPAEDRAMRSDQWQTTVGTGLAGKTLGVLGLGRLGSAVARVGLALDMDVLAWSQNLTEARCRELGVRRAASKQELLAASDIVTIHLVLSERTRGLIGRAELAAMKPTALLVNTSRGPIVEEAALIEALEARTIAGAALDVFDVEPLPADHRLRRLPNTVLTPHLGYVSAENYRVYYGQTVENILAFLDGAPKRLLNPGPA